MNKINGLFLVCCDIETGGLNGRLADGTLGMESYPIFELVFIVTDSALNQVGEPLRVVVHQSESEIAKSSQWAIDTHTESGLLAEVRASKITLIEAEKLILNYLSDLGVYKYNRAAKIGGIMAGNSIMFDRSYIMCQMPKLNSYLHYRQLDISALALAARLWCPDIEKMGLAKKTYKHKALDDILESIEELRVYKESLFTFID